MKIGYSLGGCIADLAGGKVAFEEVEVIITPVTLNPLIPRDWEAMWRNYTTRRGIITAKWIPFVGEEKRIRELVTELYIQGKIFQPTRVVGFKPKHRSYNWREITE